MEEMTDLVIYGTPLEPLDEDEVPKKKPIRIEDQIVTDEKGRRRFHGAFTGGFSAGYFNTVGTKDGWSPSNFVSSRKKKTEFIQPSAIELMDEEDKSHHGIQPQSVHITSEFAENSENRKRSLISNVRDEPIPGEPPLADLIQPASDTVGVNLLKKMGWKSGQGIGPRLHYRDKKKQRKDTESSSSNVYSCELPHDSSSEDEEIVKDRTFAPTDAKTVSFTPKDNFHGLGYKGLDKKSFLSSHINLFEPPSTKATMKDRSKLSIRGQAFGVGAFEDDDEDIYAKDDMSRYDFMLGDGLSSSKNAPKNKVHDLSKGIEGFHLSAVKNVRSKLFPPPALPRNFKPFHVCDGNKTQQAPHHKRLDRHSLSVNERSHMIGDKKDSKSVFDILSPQDKAKLELAKRFSQKTVLASNDEQTPSTSNEERASRDTFKPFTQDGDKQKRYEQFLKLMNAGHQEAANAIQPSTMTEWEKEREREEFRSAVKLYQPLSEIMASRFVKAEHRDNENNVDVSVDKLADRSEAMNAADKKMFGKLTHSEFEWHPDRILCKRFNVPNPYPSCELVGVPKVKKEKFTLFNFLNVPTEDSSSIQTQTSDDLKSRAKTGDSTDKSEKNKDVLIDAVDKKSVAEDEQKDSRPHIDMFKAIFASDESSSDEDSDENDSDSMGGTLRQGSTSKETDDKFVDPNKKLSSVGDASKIATGVFADIDFDNLNKQPEMALQLQDECKQPEATVDQPSCNDRISCDAIYGPALPPSEPPTAVHKKSSKKKKSKEKVKKHKREKKKKDKKKKSKHRSSDNCDESDRIDHELSSRLKKLQKTLQEYI